MTKYSHSSLSLLLSCPMSYYLNKIEGISPIEKKAALSIGSNVHWGIEHNTEDFTELLGENYAYGHDEILAEAMVHGYLKHKDELFNKILTLESGEKLELISEEHEVFLTGKLKSERFKEPHEFIGIVDLLLLTNKGFIIIDYKTSSQEPDWTKYLEQIYRYIFLLKSNFPDTPVCKIGIINLKKTSIRQKKTENIEQFYNRLKFEYELNDENYINYHEYIVDLLEEKLVNDYIDNLSKMCDMAKTIEDNKLWYINYSNAWGQYGKSDFYDIFYHTQDAYLLYKIKDIVYENGEVKEERNCVPIDMKVLDNTNILNHYEKYKKEASIYLGDNFRGYLRSKYIVDNNLLDIYENNLKHNL